jgi:hypothetical protein
MPRSMMRYVCTEAAWRMAVMRRLRLDAWR